MVIIISAMGSNRVIGNQGTLPWNVPEEYQQYLSFVKGQTVIMGRKSFEIFRDDLTSDYNLVVSRSASDISGGQVFPSLEEAIQFARTLDRTIFVAGGASIYRQAIPMADQMFLSFIKGDFQGDAFFPEFDQEEWATIEQVDHPAFEFHVLARI